MDILYFTEFQFSILSFYMNFLCKIFLKPRLPQSFFLTSRIDHQHMGNLIPLVYQGMKIFVLIKMFLNMFKFRFLYYQYQQSKQNSTLMEFQSQKNSKTQILHNPNQEKLEQNNQKSVGHWSSQQHTKYVIFLDIFEKQLNSKLQRRSSKIYKNMSKFILTRDAIQCRSHHTKLMRTFRNIKNIVKDLKRKIGVMKYFEIKTFITSNCDIISKYEEQIKQDIKLLSQPSQNKLNNVAVQTDLLDAENYELPIVSTPSTCQSNNLAFQFYVCTTPWTWVYQV